MNEITEAGVREMLTMCEKTTPGPWKVDKYTTYVNSKPAYWGIRGIVSKAIDDIDEPDFEDAQYIIHFHHSALERQSFMFHPEATANLEFIALSRTAFPELCCSWLALNKVAEAAPRWIPVEERLPEEYTTVLIWEGNNLFRAEYADGKWHGIPDDTGFMPEDITHWMPLPAPPEEGVM